MAENIGNIDSSRVQGRRPLTITRHRFLMLGASIVGVGMLPFAQRSYAYAESYVTPFDYKPRKGFNNDDHTAVLYNMFSDRRLQFPCHFHLPPCPNPDGWQIVMGKGFTTFPIKSNWKLTGELATPEVLAQMDKLDPSGETRRRATLPDGTVLDPASSLRRKGAVVDSQRMFENTDNTLGNDNITFSNVYVKGKKYEWAAANGGYFDIDKVSVFLRIYQNPDAASDQWNNDLKFKGCVVEEWPGISCVLYQLSAGGLGPFEVSNNKVTWSHRGSLIFRFGARNGQIHHNEVTDGGDDCIAFNSNTDSYYQNHPNNPPPKAQNVYMWSNVLSEKQAQGVRGDGQPYSGGNDIPEPPGGRRRTGNSPIAVRGGENIYIGRRQDDGQVLGNEVLYTMDGYTDVDGKTHAAQPAVEVLDYLDQTARNIVVEKLTVRQTAAGALVVPSAGVTGGVYDSVCDTYTGSTDPNPSDPWKLAPPATIFERVNLSPPDDYAP